MFEWYFWDTVGFEDKDGDHESNLIALGKQYTVSRTGSHASVLWARWQLPSLEDFLPAHSPIFQSRW